MTIKPYGNEAVLVEFEAVIDPLIHQEVTKLYRALSEANLAGIKALIPAYNSLTICYNPSLFSIETLSSLLASFSDHESLVSSASKTLRIPVCYDNSFALDIDFVLEQTQLSKARLIELHTEMLYQVYLLGFLPGFAYLGKVSAQIFCPRKEHPRLKIPRGAVGLAGHQTGIYPSNSPGGWQVIGQCPLPVFDFNLEHPFLFEVGDQVKFEAIDLSTFKAIKSNPQLWDLSPS